MSVELKNFNSEELKVLAEFNSRTHYLAIDTKAQGEGGNSIIAIAKEQITCWEKFKALFNYGTLAHKKIHLLDVAQHLATYHITPLQRAWAAETLQAERAKQAASGEPTLLRPSDEKGAYTTLCDLAHKAAFKADSIFISQNRAMQLYQAISIKEIKTPACGGTAIEHWWNPTNMDKIQFAQRVDELRELEELP